MKKNQIYLAVILVSITFITTCYFVYFTNYLSFVWVEKWLELTFIIVIPLIVFLLYYISTCDSKNQKEVRRVDTGQFGDAKFMEEDEKRKNLTTVKLNGKTSVHFPGIVLESNKYELLVDVSDRNIMLIAPPGCGKTKRFLIPTLMNNSLVDNDKKKSLLITDIKGELYESTSKTLAQNGYDVIAFNFRNPLNSHSFNMMSIINEHIDRYKNATSESDKIKEFAAAEKFTKILAELIVGDDSNQSGNSKFFYDTALGLLISIILLVSKYSLPNERHLISVLNIIIDLNGLIDGSTDVNQKNKYAELLKELENLGEYETAERLKMYSGAAISADNRTSMNIFSSTISNLTRFIDQEMEQMISSENSVYNPRKFIEKPTAIFMIIPDDNTTRHFLASLVIRNLINSLILIAEETGGLLNRLVEFILDEFGNTPAIKDFDVISTAARSRGIRMMVALQSKVQLEKIYGKDRSKIIEQSFQTVIYGTLSASAISEAEQVSKMAGTYTATTYSTSSGNNAEFISIMPNSRNKSFSEQLIKKNLIEPYEIFTLKKGCFLAFLHGCSPFKSNLDIVYDLLKNKKFNVSEMGALDLPIVSLRKVSKLTEEKLVNNIRINALSMNISLIQEDLFNFNSIDFI